MSRLNLTPTRLLEGIWNGVLTSETQDTPQIRVIHLGEVVEDVTLTQSDETNWAISVPVPKAAISDGVHTILIEDATDGEQIGHFTLIAGDPLAADIRAEVDLLRAELDMLKRAFRRHCVETN